nr:hypothetical protein [Tanacetum cinerariifolium]
IPVHQRNTKFLNNLPSYLGKYVTIVKNSKNISTARYVSLYTHLKSYEEHAMKTLSKMNQNSGNADPLAYIAKATQSTSSPSQYVLPSPQNSFLLPTTSTSINPMTQATIQAGQITTKSVQRRAPGHVATQCMEKKRAKDSQWFKDKALLMEAKEKGVVLDAEAEDFMADVECTVPYVEPLAITTTTTLKEGSNNESTFSEVHTYDDCFFDDLNHQASQEKHQEEQLDSDVDSVIDDDDDNTIPYHQYQLNNEVKSVPTNVSSDIPDGISVITILDDLRSQLTGHIKTNEE